MDSSFHSLSVYLIKYCVVIDQVESINETCCSEVHENDDFEISKKTMEK